MAKILVLDDMVDAVELTKRIMEEAGHEVFTFTEEGAALQFVRKNRIDLAILDIKLKKMSGVDVLAQIKQLKVKRAEALEAKDRRLATIYRRKISRLKSVTRRPH